MIAPADVIFLKIARSAPDGDTGVVDKCRPGRPKRKSPTQKGHHSNMIPHRISRDRLSAKTSPCSAGGPRVSCFRLGPSRSPGSSFGTPGKGHRFCTCPCSSGRSVRRSPSDACSPYPSPSRRSLTNPSSFPESTSLRPDRLSTPAVRLEHTPYPSGRCTGASAAGGCCSRTARSPALSIPERDPSRKWI